MSFGRMVFFYGLQVSAKLTILFIAEWCRCSLFRVVSKTRSKQNYGKNKKFANYYAHVDGEITLVFGL